MKLNSLTKQILIGAFLFVSSSCTSTRVADLTNSANETVELYTTIIPKN
jgi:hypothetical protein